MKKALLAVLLACAPMTPAVLVAPALLSAGCTTPQKVTAYRTLASIATAVDSAMKAFADAVVTGKVDIATQTKVRELHGRYVPAMQAAILAARFDTTAPTPESLKALATELLDLVVATLK